MSNPTSNFGWQMPTPTDLVTDLPADFEVFGQAVDSSMADLKGGTTGQILSKATNTDMDFVWIANDQGDITAVNVTSPITGGGTSGAVTVGIQDGTTTQKGAVQLENSTSSTSTTTAAVPAAVKSAYDLGAAAIPKSTVTTNGDIIYGTGSGTVTRLGIGSTGQALLVSGGVPAWGSVTAGSNWSLLGSAALTGAQTVTISGISGKNKLLVLITNASVTVASASIGIRMNGVSNVYYQTQVQLAGPTSYSSTNLGSFFNAPDAKITLGDMNSSASGTVSGYVLIDGANTSGLKTYTYAGSGNSSGGNSQYGYIGAGYYDTASTISQINAFNGSGNNFDAGTMYVYSSVN